MFIDEPGLQFLFSALSGYNDMAARKDVAGFLEMIERPRGIHLCGNPDWDFLLSQDMDVLSMDIYTNAEVFSSYAASIKRFLDRGGVIVWGIVPTNFEPFEKENIDLLEHRLEAVWEALWKKASTGTFSCPEACSLRPPAVWSTRMAKRPLKRRFE